MKTDAGRSNHSVQSERDSNPEKAHTDETVTTCPVPAANMAGKNARTVQKLDTKFTSNVPGATRLI